MLPLLTLRLHFTAETAGDLGDFPGAVWRSVMGLHLQRRTCLGEPGRESCALGEHCAYHAIISPQPPTTAKLIGGKHNAPPPYILSPRSTGTIHEGDIVILDLTLIGHGSRHGTNVIRALQAGAEQGLGKDRLRLRLDAVHARTAGNDGQSLDPQSLPAPTPPPDAPPAPSRIRIQLQQPLRLREQNKYINPKDFTLRALVKSLLLRLRNLSDIHTPNAPQPEVAPMLSQLETLTVTPTLRWQQQQRWSARQHSTVEGSGLLGHIDIATTDGAQLPNDLWQLLWLGQWLHVGKGTVMGLGRYQLTPSHG